MAKARARPLDVAPQSSDLTEEQRDAIRRRPGVIVHRRAASGGASWEPDIDVVEPVDLEMLLGRRDEPLPAP